MTQAAPASRWPDAALAVALFAVDPAGLGGVVLRAPPGPVREYWLDCLRDALPDAAPMRRIPLHVTDGRLLGGLDLSATLHAGRPIAEHGLLAEANNGIALLAMADCVTPNMAARLTAVLDTGEIALERDGLAARTATRFGVVALDEGASDDERPPAALRDRLAFHIDINEVSVRQMEPSTYGPDQITAARSRLAQIPAGEEAIEALCATASALGIESLRAPLLALRVARAISALAADEVVGPDAVALAARLVFASRATTLPAPAPESGDQDSDAQTGEDDAQSSSEDDDNDTAAAPEMPLRDVVLTAVQAAIPAGLLDQLRSGTAPRSLRSANGRAGALQKSRSRGRPIGTFRGDPRSGVRLNLIETLRAAAPWQRLRSRAVLGNVQHVGTPRVHAPRVQIRRDDFRITRYKQRTQSITIFVVDASGSAALHRLAEAKGAVELLLVDSYVRRDRVALISFRGQGAELLLPPTRSLVRARRCLSGLPGGGGTPLAAGIDTAVTLADTLHRRGDTPTIVLLTDGRANVARDGSGGRDQAICDSTAAARRIRAARFASVLIDTSPRPQALAERLATDMGARYLPMPHADAATLSRAIQAAAPSS